MKSPAKWFLIPLLLLCLTPTFAQNSASATSAPQAVNRDAVIRTLLGEIDAGRDYIAKLEAREAALTDETQKAEAAHNELSKAYRDAVMEIGELRATIRYEKLALAERQKQVEDLRSQRDTARTERDDARKEVKSLKKENRLMKAVLIIRTAADLIRFVW